MINWITVHAVDIIIVFVNRCREPLPHSHRCYQSYLLVLEHRPPVNEGLSRHVVHRIVDLPVEGAVFEPALVEVADAEQEDSSVAVSTSLRLRAR